MSIAPDITARLPRARLSGCVATRRVDTVRFSAVRPRATKTLCDRNGYTVKFVVPCKYLSFSVPFLSCVEPSLRYVYGAFTRAMPNDNPQQPQDYGAPPSRATVARCARAPCGAHTRHGEQSLQPLQIMARHACERKLEDSSFSARTRRSANLQVRMASQPPTVASQPLTVAQQHHFVDLATPRGFDNIVLKCVFV